MNPLQSNDGNQNNTQQTIVQTTALNIDDAEVQPSTTFQSQERTIDHANSMNVPNPDIQAAHDGSFGGISQVATGQQPSATQQLGQFGLARYAAASRRPAANQSLNVQQNMSQNMMPETPTARPSNNMARQFMFGASQSAQQRIRNGDDTFDEEIQQSNVRIQQIIDNHRTSNTNDIPSNLGRLNMRDHQSLTTQFDNINMQIGNRSIEESKDDQTNLRQADQNYVDQMLPDQIISDQIAPDDDEDFDQQSQTFDIRAFGTGHPITEQNIPQPNFFTGQPPAQNRRNYDARSVQHVPAYVQAPTNFRDAQSYMSMRQPLESMGIRPSAVQQSMGRSTNPQLEWSELQNYVRGRDYYAPNCQRMLQSWVSSDTNKTLLLKNCKVRDVASGSHTDRLTSASMFFQQASAFPMLARFMPPTQRAFVQCSHYIKTVFNSMSYGMIAQACDSVYIAIITQHRDSQVQAAAGLTDVANDYMDDIGMVSAYTRTQNRQLPPPRGKGKGRARGRNNNQRLVSVQQTMISDPEAIFRMIDQEDIQGEKMRLFAQHCARKPAAYPLAKCDLIQITRAGNNGQFYCRLQVLVSSQNRFQPCHQRFVRAMRSIDDDEFVRRMLTTRTETTQHGYWVINTCLYPRETAHFERQEPDRISQPPPRFVQSPEQTVSTNVMLNGTLYDEWIQQREEYQRQQIAPDQSPGLQQAQFDIAVQAVIIEYLQMTMHNEINQDSIVELDAFQKAPGMLSYCSVCLGHMNFGRCGLLICKHVLCMACIRALQAQHQERARCPVCKQPLKELCFGTDFSGADHAAFERMPVRDLRMPRDRNMPSQTGRQESTYAHTRANNAHRSVNSGDNVSANFMSNVGLNVQQDSPSHNTNAPDLSSGAQTMAYQPAMSNSAHTMAHQPAMSNSAHTMAHQPAISNGAQTIAHQPAMSNGAQMMARQPTMRQSLNVSNLASEIQNQTMSTRDQVQPLDTTNQQTQAQQTVNQTTTTQNQATVNPSQAPQMTMNPSETPRMTMPPSQALRMTMHPSQLLNRQHETQQTFTGSLLNTTSIQPLLPAGVDQNSDSAQFTDGLGHVPSQSMAVSTNTIEKPTSQGTLTQRKNTKRIRSRRARDDFNKWPHGQRKKSSKHSAGDEQDLGQRPKKVTFKIMHRRNQSRLDNETSELGSFSSPSKKARSQTNSDQDRLNQQQEDDLNVMLNDVTSEDILNQNAQDHDVTGLQEGVDQSQVQSQGPLPMTGLQEGANQSQVQSQEPLPMTGLQEGANQSQVQSQGPLSYLSVRSQHGLIVPQGVRDGEEENKEHP